MACEIISTEGAVFALWGKHENAKTVSTKVERSLLRDVEDILALAEQKGLLQGPQPHDF